MARKKIKEKDNLEIGQTLEAVCLFVETLPDGTISSIEFRPTLLSPGYISCVVSQSSKHRFYSKVFKDFDSAYVWLKDNL